MSSSALPPLGNLPSWSRVSTLDRSRYPKPFLRDRLQALPPPGNTTHGNVPFEGGQAVVDFKFLDGIPPADQQRLVYYNKSIKFLQQQHSETLKKLHDEIDYLKKQNKELQFQYVMIKDGSNKLDAASAENFSHVLLPQSIGSNYKEEIQHLQDELDQAKAQNIALHEAINDKINKRKHSISKSSKSKIIETPYEDIDDNESVLSVNSNKSLPLSATLDPLQVRDTPTDEPRSPTLSECQTIIKHLYKVNSRQNKELSMLKINIKDMLATKEANIIRGSSVKSFTRENKSQSANEASKLPKVQMKRPTARTILQPSLSATEHVTFPAVKNSLVSNVADRRKRQQAVQRARTKKDI